ncbi:MAG: LacI family transcriptional regulator [Gammaproteobacteria bacterium]|nr:LacI family transcriptional regulator [Gammaproteobacteria bacterium]
MATITDIAKVTGMARTTVAEILRNKPGYNEQTRQRVLAAAKELNYQPNYLSKALAGGKSMTIGLVMSSITTPVTFSKVLSIESQAREQGYLTYLAGWGVSDDREMVDYIRDLLARRVDGIIAYHLYPLPQNAIDLLMQANIPVAYLDWGPKDSPRVKIDRQPGIDELVSHLASLGHKKISFLHTQEDRDIPALKADRYAQACKKNGLELNFDADWSLGDPANVMDTDAITAVIKQAIAKHKPTALLSSNDQIAGLAIGSLLDLGYKVPDDISVCGFDDMPVSHIPRPQLTTVRQPRGEAGSAAVDLLMAMMHNKPLPEYPPVFPCRLVMRDSTGKAKV